MTFIKANFATPENDSIRVVLDLAGTDVPEWDLSGPASVPVATGNRHYAALVNNAVPIDAYVAPVLTPLEQAVQDLHGQGINSDAMTKATFLAATKGDDTKLDLIEAAIDAAVVAYGVTYAEIVEAL